MKSSKEVDWDIAPDGATHYNVSCASPWLKGTPASYFNDVKEVWIEYKSDDSLWEDHFFNAVKRPQEMENEEWDGSGVPPVGTVCEYQLNGGVWFMCKIIYVLSGSDDCFVAWCDHLRTDQFLTFSSRRYKLQLRKIKTPEQIEAEERLLAIDEMVDLAQRSGSIFKDVMSALYDVGYRKHRLRNEK